MPQRVLQITLGGTTAAQLLYFFSMSNMSDS